MTIMTIVTRLIMTIILKCIENTKSLCCRTGTLTPQCWRSIILQKGTNKFMEKDGGEGELDEGSQKAQTSGYKINRLLLFSVIKSCPTLWDSVDYSTSASSVLHYLLDCSNSCPLTPKTQVTKAKFNKYNCIKLSSFCRAKETIKKWKGKRQARRQYLQII